MLLVAQVLSAGVVTAEVVLRELSSVFRYSPLRVWILIELKFKLLNRISESKTFINRFFLLLLKLIH